MMFGVATEEELHSLIRAAKAYVWSLVGWQVVAIVAVGILGRALWLLMGEVRSVVP